LDIPEHTATARIVEVSMRPPLACPRVGIMVYVR
jgi:hypothetical protein